MNPKEETAWQELMPNMFQCKYCIHRAVYYVDTHGCDSSLICTEHYVAHQRAVLDKINRAGAIKCMDCKEIFKKYADWITVHLL